MLPLWMQTLDRNSHQRRKRPNIPQCPSYKTPVQPPLFTPNQNTSQQQPARANLSTIYQLFPHTYHNQQPRTMRTTTLLALSLAVAASAHPLSARNYYGATDVRIPDGVFPRSKIYIC